MSGYHSDEEDHITLSSKDKDTVHATKSGHASAKDEPIGVVSFFKITSSFMYIFEILSYITFFITPIFHSMDIAAWKETECKA